MASALQDFLDDTDDYPVVVINALKQRMRSALAELNATKASTGDLALILKAHQQTIADLLALSSAYVMAVAVSQADRKQLNDRVAALELKPAVRNVAMAAPVALGLLSVGSRDITLTWDRTLPDTNYEPEWWPSLGLLGSASFKTKTKTTTQVVVTVANTALISAGGSLGAIAVRTV